MKLRNKKTGEIHKLLGTKMEMGIIWLNIQLEHREPKAYCYNSLAELNEEWEDYEPTEPLIKDEKIRKTVKAWAESNGIKKIIVFDCGNNAPYTPVGEVKFAGNGSHLEIRFRTEERFDTDRIYTVTELCGEEEK